jgi:hypothetical protein
MAKHAFSFLSVNGGREGSVKLCEMLDVTRELDILNSSVPLSHSKRPTSCEL